MNQLNISQFDQNAFFKQITLMICSSLDIEKALQSVLAYLTGIMPADEMLINAIPPQKKMHFVAHVSHSTIFPIRQTTIPSSLKQQQINDMNSEPRLVNDTDIDPFCSAMASYVDNKGCSELFIPLKIDGETLGMLVLRARKKHCYTEEHLQLLFSVREPFAIATSNALRYRELLFRSDQLTQDNILLREELKSQGGTEIVGSLGGLAEVMDLVSQVSPLKTAVLLLGETGVGKEVIANAIHSFSSRKDGPFIKVNCGAIPETLIDSELFGHEKGAFSGASAQKKVALSVRMVEQFFSTKLVSCHCRHRCVYCESCRPRR